MISKQTNSTYDEHNLRSINYLIGGGIAGCTAAFLTTPLDVLKTRIQTQTTTGVVRYKGTIDAISTIYRVEGLKGYFRGGGARMLYVTPSKEINFIIFYRLIDSGGNHLCFL